jgi:hypothetical protein
LPCDFRQGLVLTIVYDFLSHTLLLKIAYSTVIACSAANGERIKNVSTLSCSIEFLDKLICTLSYCVDPFLVSLANHLFLRKLSCGSFVSKLLQIEGFVHFLENCRSYGVFLFELNIYFLALLSKSGS